MPRPSSAGYRKLLRQIFSIQSLPGRGGVQILCILSTCSIPVYQKTLSIENLTHSQISPPIDLSKKMFSRAEQFYWCSLEQILSGRPLNNIATLVIHFSLDRNYRNNGRQQPISLPHNNFPFIDELPLELVLQIASWLPTSSGAALALCNYRLFDLFRRRPVSPLKAMNSQKEERELFLATLSKDVVDTFFCLSCKKLHILSRGWQQSHDVYSAFIVTSDSRCTPPENTTEFIDHHWDEYFRHFTLEHAQVAIKLYQRGLVTDADRFMKYASITRPRPKFLSEAPTNAGFELFEALIIGGKIYVRTQIWMFVSQDRGYQLPSTMKAHACSHMDLDFHGKGLWSSLLECKLGHIAAGTRSCGKCSKTRGCPTCETEIYVDTLTVKSNPGVQVIRTTQWYTMFTDLSVLVVPKITLDLRTRPPVRWEIRDTFEQQTATPFDSIVNAEESWEAVRYYAGGHYYGRVQPDIDKVLAQLCIRQET